MSDETTPTSAMMPLAMLRRCQEQFAFYEQSHRAKGTPDADAKAETNAGMVASIAATIEQFGGIEDEVQFWRKEAVARAWFAGVAYRAARGDTSAESLRAMNIRIDRLEPALRSIDAAQTGGFHANCEACGKPLLQGQFVVNYDDIGEAHANCEAPFINVGGYAYDDGFSDTEMQCMIREAREAINYVG